MSDQKTPARYEPGELDKTRKNLGTLDKKESERMVKLLGGEVGIEKSAPLGDEQRKQMQKIGLKNRSGSIRGSRNVAGGNESGGGTGREQSTGIKSAPIMQKKLLPTLSAIEQKYFFILMSSPEHQIVQKPNILQIILSLGKVSGDHLSSAFVHNRLPAHVKHIDNFLESIQHLLFLSSPQYKEKVAADNGTQFHALRVISQWNTDTLKLYLKNLTETKSSDVADAIPFIRELFRYLMQFYFLGEEKITEIIKKVYIDANTVENTDKDENLAIAKVAAQEWIYISRHIIKGMYPLLMRMTISQCEEYPDFYRKYVAKILPFLGMTKYDLVLPKKDSESETAGVQENQKKATETNSGDVATGDEKDNDKKNTSSVKQSLKADLEVLDILFPDAGWLQLEKRPDMYPYFQSLYQIEEGFNLLSPSNPLQVTVVLLKIAENFFQACHNIRFLADNDEEEKKRFFPENESVQTIMSDWPEYCGGIFYRDLSPELRDYVNRIDASTEFKNSKYGRKQLSNWLWLTKYYFLPHLSFEISVLGRPIKDSAYMPLSVRVKQLVAFFSELVQDAKTPDGQKKADFTTHYRFSVESPVSYRLNILLGGEKSPKAININLLRYTLHVLRVLDWWINDPDSLAYDEAIKIPYRAEPGTEQPVFSLPQRSDQKRVFAENIKRLRAEKEAQKASGEAK